MKITVGSILFNSVSTLSEELFEEWLKATYDIGDEIILVEGATSVIGEGDTSWATRNGKSTDNTLEIIRSFPDPLKKIKIIEGNGFWASGKTGMCNEWAKNMTGDYIWQIDNDEFYLRKDVAKIKIMLEDKKPDAVHFYANHFWGDFNHCIDETNGQAWGNDIPWIRIFRHVNGAKWMSHEPPEYRHPNGLICNRGKVVSRDETLKIGIKMFHYSYVKKSQIDFKSRFFRNPLYVGLWEKWHRDDRTPLINGVVTKRFGGEHPIKFSGRNEHGGN